MTFNAKQEAIEIVGETEFYEFSFGNGEIVERYTTRRRPTVAFGFTWTPLPIVRVGINDTQNLEPQAIKLRLPVRTPFMDLVAKAGLDALVIKVIRGFGDDFINDYVNPWWVGLLEDITIYRNVMEGNLKGAESLFDTVVPKILHQAPCNNNLFDVLCGLNPLSWMVTRNVTSITNEGRILVLDGAIPATDYYTAGRIRKHKTPETRVWRSILQQAGPNYALNVAILDLNVGDQVDILPGCLKRIVEDCVGKFNNKNKAAAMADIPKTNPIIDGF